MSNPNPGSSAGGIGPGLGAGEAPSDVDWNSSEDGKGMTVDDALTSAYDDDDRSQNGIAEGERETMGKWLKSNADHVGTTVRDGLVNLVDTATVLRNGSQDQKRQMLGHLIDNHNVRPEPTAEAAPQYDATGDPDMAQPLRPILDQQQANAAVSDFVQSNPVAGDPSIQAAMISVAEDMVRQGHTPHLPTMLQHAVQGDPRYSQAAAQAQEADQVARAKAANVQVSGGGKSTGAAGQSSDVGDILDELVPR